VGMATEIGYSVPNGSLDFWADRLKQGLVQVGEQAERFGEQYLPFTDPDGLNIALIIPKKEDSRIAWETESIKQDTATKGFHSVTLTLSDIDKTAAVLTDIFGYSLVSQEGNRYRFATDAVENAAIVDLLASPNGNVGRNAAGTNHHVAFRVANDTIQMEYREKVLSKGLQITPKIDRDYFFSLYFREPGGVLFEIATAGPGFLTDESEQELGMNLKLPSQFEHDRSAIEAALPRISFDPALFK
ncbi:MAG: ring-cleaving dioxygenase, partial [Chitinophagaceae bacterium]